MTLTEAFALASFSLFSFADLRYRLVPGIEAFLFGTILLTLPVTPMQTGIVILACAWGILRNISSWFALPLLFYPPAWPILLTGYGYRGESLEGLICWRSLVLPVFFHYLLCCFPCLVWRSGADFGFADKRV
jgi:hypothetical protein